MGLTFEEIGVNVETDNFVHIFNRPELIIEGQHQMHPLVQWVPPHTVHCTDYISIMMLKRTIPDDEKRIKIEFKDVSESIESQIGTKLEDLVIFHVGTGAPEKTRLFPEDYAQRLVDALVKRGLKVAIFATTDYRSSAAKIKAPIDLVDRLDWDGFCTLIAKAPVLVSNDSSPVHLASAFDNWLVAIPTVKHPDRLIHLRHGHRYWKTFAVYKKLLCDDSVEIPIDTFVTRFDWGDVYKYLEDYLPDVDTVARMAEYSYVLSKMATESNIGCIVQTAN
jgi:hypothetical protein